MLCPGLERSRHRLEVQLMDEAWALVWVAAAAPDADGLTGLVGQTARSAQPVLAAIESRNGARFVHDSSSWAGGRSSSPTPRRSRGWPGWPGRPTGSTPGWWPSVAAATWDR